MNARNMRVFTPRPAEEYEWVIPRDSSDYFLLEAFNGSPLLDSWTPIEVELYTRDERDRRLRQSDSPWFSHDALVFRRPARDVLMPVIERSVELLPLVCKAASLELVNVLSVVDCLDEDESTITRYSTGRIMSIDRPVFKPDMLESLAIFRLPQETRGPIYVLQNFVQAFREANLKGLEFELLWSG